MYGVTSSNTNTGRHSLPHWGTLFPFLSTSPLCSSHSISSLAELLLLLPIMCSRTDGGYDNYQTDWSVSKSNPPVTPHIRLWHLWQLFPGEKDGFILEKTGFKAVETCSTLADTHVAPNRVEIKPTDTLQAPHNHTAAASLCPQRPNQLQCQPFLMNPFITTSLPIKSTALNNGPPSFCPRYSLYPKCHYFPLPTVVIKIFKRNCSNVPPELWRRR